MIHKELKAGTAEVFVDCDESKMTMKQVQAVGNALDRLARALQLELYRMPKSNQRLVMQRELDRIQTFYQRNYVLMHNRALEREHPTPPRHRKP